MSVDAAAVRPLRAQVLRSGQPPARAVFIGDDHPDAMHAAVLLEGEIVGVASVMREPFPLACELDGWRVRGMASTPALRGRGIGTALLARCEAHAREHGGELLWCKARVGARSLYERAGMVTVGKPFEEPPLGVHYLMRKLLQDAPAGAGTC